MGEDICKRSVLQDANIQNIYFKKTIIQHQKTSNLINKWAADLKRQFSKEDIRWPTGT